MHSLIILAVLLGDMSASQEADLGCKGKWYTEDQRSIVEIHDCGDGTLCGRVVWIDPDKNNIFIDDRNKDPELRGRPMIGATILKGYERKEHIWTGGEIYNPENGKTYASKMMLEEDGSLLVKGCVGPICKRLKWTRVPISE